MMALNSFYSPALIRRRRTIRGQQHAIFFILVVLSFAFVIKEVAVEGFINNNNNYHHHHCHPNQWRNSNNNVLQSTSTETEIEIENDTTHNDIDDIDIVGENRRGDAKGAALRLVDVTVSRAGVSLVRNINWRIEPNDKWALVGANGCGKSTLLKAILNDITDNKDPNAIIDYLDVDGDITIQSKQQVGYLKQTAVSGSIQTIFEEASSSMKDITSARTKLRRAEQQVESYSTTDDTIDTESTDDTDDTEDESTDLNHDLKLLDDARQHYERVGGYIQEQEVHTLLQGLGFTNMTQLCSELSGGWQMRVSFAKMLLSKPSLCLLDEPSNHLDRSARKWLANYLKNYQDGALLLVTHDIELLKSCNHIAEITGTEGSSRTVQIYKSCTYEQYLLQKRERAIAAQLEYEKNMEKFQKLQAFVDKWGASATKASAAQSRVIQIEKMREQGLLEPPSTAISEIVKFKPRLTLPDPPAPQGGIGDSSDSSGSDHNGDDNGILLALRGNAAVGYAPRTTTTTDDADNENENSEVAAATAIANATPLITDINLDIQQGMKILIRGPNGAGKTTLLDTLRGRLPLLNGERVEDSNLRLGVFTQDLAQELDVSRRAVDLVTEYARSGDDGNIFISDQEARNILGGLGLQGEKALRKVGQLSGGEKARVALAQFALKPSNLYLLDEVSNHLDIECVEALSEVLSDWGDGKGAIVVISHDKAFCEQVGFTHILTITGDGQLQLEQRDANDNDWDSSGRTFQKSGDVNDDDDDDDDSTDNVVDKELYAKRRKMAFNAPKRISKIETLVEKKEEKIAVLDEEMLANGSDVGALVDLSKKKVILEEQVMELMEEWEELETVMAEMEGEEF